MRVLNHKNRLPLADAAKHADVVVVAERIENITGGGAKAQLTEKQILQQEQQLLQQTFLPQQLAVQSLVG